MMKILTILNSNNDVELFRRRKIESIKQQIFNLILSF